MHLVGGAVRTLARRFSRPGRRGLRRSPASAARRRCSGGRRRSLQRGKPLHVATLRLLARTDRFSGTDLLRPRVAASIGMSFFTMRLTASEIVRPIPAARSFYVQAFRRQHSAPGARGCEGHVGRPEAKWAPVMHQWTCIWPCECVRTTGWPRDPSHTPDPEAVRNGSGAQ